MSSLNSPHADLSGGIVIVGAGLAGATTAEALRSEGFEGDLHLVGAEMHRPYNRPPLSKEVLTGAAAPDSAFVHDFQWYLDNDVELLTGDAAVALDLPGRRVRLSSGRVLPYRRLALATGASPRKLDVPGAHLAGIRYLRTVDDSAVLRADLESGAKHVVVVGSGWIGLEVAAAARSYGNQVTVVAPGTIPLASALGAEMGAFFRELHRQHDVRFRMRTRVTGFVGSDGEVRGVMTDAGHTIGADLVVVGIGAVPNVALAREAGLDVHGGVSVDAALRTEDPAVFAVGDVADAWHPTLGHRLRSEHWANAIDQGKAVARSILGQRVSYDVVPYFFTDQYDVGMEYAGFFSLSSGADVVYRGDVESGEFVAFWQQSGRVVAGMNVNVWGVNDAIKQLVSSARVVKASRLADPSVPIGEL
ncbi:NADPH-dependent 2,4-dienoyl-CoA reductase/sulfur reductase-like enzyme [Okibacterium sp. HSC-33S16]|uniref:NAD(P)/FAD-dependent oxidoreductase n=1 Tax=Okibacterium sp. HSC-33S16 TaxID=2910965 RepID=UPI00209D36B1|nr:FAD-dependent oxidoreductase [Okibacterium sp. HSC-33S16]MCP2030179.1 NADPH-dependent 2,4-dienoyl-CoA reductase/sulfur reductase-like enzyme [Okibacterium sp. HSC-33S16]